MIIPDNFKLIEREQGPVIQPRYDEMSGRTGGGFVTGQMTDQADTPIQGSDTYREYSKEGNIANYDPDTDRTGTGAANDRRLGGKGGPIPFVELNASSNDERPWIPSVQLYWPPPREG